MSALSIERGSRVAFRARVGKVLGVGILNVVGVEALNVLPGIACFAVYRVPVIVSEAAYTLDSVRLFLNRPDLGARRRELRRLGLGTEKGRLTRRHDMRRKRLQFFGHNLKDTSRDGRAASV